MINKKVIPFLNDFYLPLSWMVTYSHIVLSTVRYSILHGAYKDQPRRIAKSINELFKYKYSATYSVPSSNRKDLAECTFEHICEYF